MDVEKLMEGVSEQSDRIRASDSSLELCPIGSSSSGIGALNNELITEVSQALEEMTSSWDTSTYVGGGVQQGESHPISVPDHLTIDPFDIKKVRRIAKGDFAEVYEATWLGCTCAVKRFSTSYSVELVSLVQKEMNFLIELRHPHIVRLMGLSVDSQQRCSIVMEFMSSSLRALIEERLAEKKETDNLASLVPFAPSEALDIITRMALGMWFLHSKGVSHRDLKSPNVLIQGSGGYFEVKIVDFGASLNIDSSGIEAVSVVGTGFWRAPEILRLKTDKSCKPDLKAADVYSFAMTCYEVLTGKLPFQDLLGPGPKESEKVTAGLRPELPTNLDGELRRLIKACWDPDPTLRPNFEKICKELVFIRSKKPGVRITQSIGKDMILSPFRWISHVYGACSRLLDWVLGNLQSTRFSDSDSNLSWSDDDESRSGEDWDGVNASQRIINAALPKLKNQFKLLSFIKPSNLKDPQCIGKGASSRIYKATWLGCTFAVKRFKGRIRGPNGLRFTQLLEYEAQELEFLMTLCHPHIVQLVGLSIGSNEVRMIVMEMMDSNLRQLIDSRMRKMREGCPVSLDTYEKGFLEYGYVPFALHEAVFIIRKIALGMAFLHSRDVVHRDLKSPNVLIQELHSGYFDVKLVDFGVSQYFYESETHEDEIVGDTSCRLGVGTRFWRAPEILPTSTVFVDGSKKPDLKAADVYSFAMTCYEVITGQVPMSDLRPCEYGKVIEGYRPTLPSDICPANLKVLIEQCWHGEPERRPDFTYICEELQRIEQALVVASAGACEGMALTRLLDSSTPKWRSWLCLLVVTSIHVTRTSEMLLHFSFNLRHIYTPACWSPILDSTSD